MAFSDLPVVNAILNGLTAILLTAGYYFIRQRNKIAHRNCMVSAFIASVLFLICYITYHSYVAAVLHKGPTVFKDPVGSKSSNWRIPEDLQDGRKFALSPQRCSTLAP